MSKILRVVVLTTALLAALTSTAGAVTWDNSGDTAFTASGGPSTIDLGGVGFSCTGPTVTGTTTPSPFTGTVAATGTVTYGHCTSAGIPTAFDCSYSQTLSSQAGGVSSGALDVTCGVYQFNTKLCHIAGSVTDTYTNPAGGGGTFTLSSSPLTLSNGPSGTCPYTTSGTFTAQTWTVTAGTGGPAPHNGPVFTRTA
jgi:hypothetical protein